MGSSDGVDSDSISSFRVPEGDRRQWITVFGSEYYPDHLKEREAQHRPTFMEFRDLVSESSSSEELYRRIMDADRDIRTQLCRVFRRFVLPGVSVERLKKVTKVDRTIEEYGDRFREFEEVKERVESRPEEDTVLFALLGTHDSRGEKGYQLTERFFEWFEAEFEDEGFSISGPKRAGKDVDLSEELEQFSEPVTADFLIRYDGDPVCAGFARYDKGRGGAQEDDRTGGNMDYARQITSYESPDGMPRLKVLFVNDGPGLLEGSMWRDYARLEDVDPDLVKVVTLQMLEHRVSREWLLPYSRTTAAR